MTKQREKLYILFGISILLTAFSLLTGTTLGILLFAIYLAATHTPLPKNLRHNLTTQLLAGLFVVAGFIQSGTVLMFLAHMKTSFLILSLTALVGSLGLAVYAREKTKGSFTLQKPSQIDLLILVMPMIICAFVWSRTILPTKDDSISIIQSVSFGMDDSTHSSIFGDLLRSNGNLFASSEQKDTMALKWHAGYPMGWHVTTATFASSIAPTRDLPMITNLTLYYWAKVASLFVALLCISALFVSLLSKSKEALHHRATTLAVLSLLYIGVLIVLPLYHEGFFSFLPVIAATALFSSCLTARSAREPLPIFLLTLLTIVSAITWMITAPILTIAYLYAIYRETDRYTLQIIKRNLLPLLLMVGATAAQAFLYKSINADRSIESLAEAGGIMAPTHILLIILLVIYGYSYVRAGEQNIAKKLLPIVGASLLVLVCVLAVITIKSPTISYYYYKLQSVVVILLLCFALARVTDYMTTTRLLKSFESIIILLIVFGLTVPSIIGYEYARAALGRMHDYTISDQAAESLKNGALARPFSANNSRFIYYIEGNSPETILSSNLARSSYRSTSCDGSVFTGAYTQNYTRFVDSVRRCSSKTLPITIYSSTETYNKLRADLSNSQGIIIRKIDY